MASLNLTLLQAKLQENVADYNKIFALRLANGFNYKNDPLFTVLGVRDGVPLIREITTSVVQPGRKGTTNFTENAVSLKNREAKLRPFKVDLRLDEQTLYTWSKNYIAKKKAADPTDIYSAPALDWYMGAIMRQIGKDFNTVMGSGVYNASGTNLQDTVDGFFIKWTQGYATTGVGAVGDIPAANKVTAAATINQSNILAEINNMVMNIILQLDDAVNEEGTLFMDPVLYAHLINAMNATLSNGDQVVFREGGVLKLSVLPNTVVKPYSWLKGTSGIVWTVNGNMFWLTPETELNVPSIQIEKADRALKIFMDGESGFDYADGRYMFLNSKL